MNKQTIVSILAICIVLSLAVVAMFIVSRRTSYDCGCGCDHCECGQAHTQWDRSDDLREYEGWRD